MAEDTRTNENGFIIEPAIPNSPASQEPQVAAPQEAPEIAHEEPHVGETPVHEGTQDERLPDERLPREQEVRTQDERPSDEWIPASALPVPNPQDGFVFRFIRTSQLGNVDNANVSQRFREGWVPVLAVDHPEFAIMSDINSQFKDNVEVGGLLLCKAPEELMAKRDVYYQKIADSQMQAVDKNFMKQNDSRMPLLEPERKTRTTFGRG